MVKQNLSIFPRPLGTPIAEKTSFGTNEVTFLERILHLELPLL